MVPIMDVLTIVVKTDNLKRQLDDVIDCYNIHVQVVSDQLYCERNETLRLLMIFPGVYLRDRCIAVFTSQFRGRTRRGRSSSPRMRLS